MRPLRSFFLLLIFLACFTGLHYIIPESRFFPSIGEFIPLNIANELFVRNQAPDSFTEPDTIKSINEGIVSTSDTIATSKDKASVNPLNPFLDSLRQHKGQIRILYYGDSQIEGDRITSYLRHILRNNNGGTGPGLFLPLMPVMYSNSLWLSSSSNWIRFNYLSYNSGEISHQKFGPFMTICRYLPEAKTSVIPVKAYVRIKPSNFADSASSAYDILRIFYRNNEGIVKVIIKADDRIVLSDTLKSGNNLNESACKLNRAKEILIEFEGRVSPDIYGISIESANGVIVDNIPQRGSAGLEFTMVDKENLSESYKKLSPDLFILHYGLNIVKNIRTEYSYYQEGLERQLLLLKEISPSTPVLVIGLTDMALISGDSIASYRNIPAIINAQRRASVKAGVAFFDSYSAMGGYSSIVKWRDMEPPLAHNDYTHLTSQGADSLAKILSDALFSQIKIDSVTPEPLEVKTDTLLSVISQNPLTSITDGKKAGNLLSQLFEYDQLRPLIFSKAAFWLFLLLVLAGYSIVFKKPILRNGYLLLVSLFFYYKSGGLFLFLLIFVTIIDFSIGLLIHHSGRKFMRKFFVLMSILSNIGILAYFKYTGFLINTINNLLGTDYKAYDFLAAFSNSHIGTSFNVSNIILPVGISFFTFQSLSYIFDVYRRKVEPVRNIVDFGFYVSFFPQLVAGPIVRASEFIPQLYTDFHLARREFSHALFLISKGLIKKIVISDFIAVNFIDRVFDAPAMHSGFENLMAIYGYGLQIYCDFSGYTDIAIGVALILGFRLPVNFNSPYKADSISDFWKRWHISLSRWLKDYLYIPLGGNRKGKIRTGINLIVTMLLGGLWHGAAIRFVVWGALHGIGLVINKIWNSISGSKNRKGFWKRAIHVFITFQFVSFCWIFFRAPDMDSVKIMLLQIFENFSPGSYIKILTAFSSVFLLILTGYAIHFLPERVKESYRGVFIRTPMVIQLFIIMCVAVVLYQMRLTEVMPFIYFRF